MIIETDNKELLTEYILQNILINQAVLPYFDNQKTININYGQNTYDLFDDGLTVTKLENITGLEIYNDQLYWIEKLTAEDKKIIKKNNLEQISLKKLTKSLKSRLMLELDFDSSLEEFSSYYEIIEEEYLFSLAGIRKQKIFKPMLFMLGLKNIDQFYNNLNDDEFQLIVSLIFTKALKQNNQVMANKIMLIDRTIKTTNNVLTPKNIFGVNMFLD